MPNVTVLRSFRFKGRTLEQHEEHELSEGNVKIYEAIGFVKRVVAETVSKPQPTKRKKK